MTNVPVTAPPKSRRPVKKRVKARYDRHMPDKWHHRAIVWILFISGSICIAVQLLYPPDRALPLAKIGSQRVAWYKHEQLAATTNLLFRDSRLKLVVDGQTTSEVSLASLGAESNTEKMINRLIDYPFWQRFIPFSIFLHGEPLTYADVYYSEHVLREASILQAEALSFGPLNARLAIEDGMLVATDERRGSDVHPSSVYTAIAQARPELGGITELVVPSIRSKPTETAASLAAVRTAAETALGRQVIIRAGEHTFVPDYATIASWLKIGTDSEGRSVLEIDGQKLKEFYDHIDKTAGVPAGRTNINLINGRETDRQTGKSGLAIDREALSAQISEWLLAGKGRAEHEATLKEVTPSVMYDNKYTATEEGLRSYIEDAAKRLNVRIAIEQLDGERWTASFGANESIPSASTYKLFVAKWLFDQMNKGFVQWDDKVLDTTVSTCFDRMIIASTNPCAESWLAQAGRSNFNGYMYSLGFSTGTTFTHSLATHTTANDLQKMMRGIHDGTLIAGPHRDRLLDAIDSHPYRFGIPAGSNGMVWDKVGFLWDYIHDTAIVKHPKGTYIMTIMTRGHSYATIASLTREIERIMYP